MLRFVSTSAIVVAFMAAGHEPTVRAAEQPTLSPAALFITLPMTNGYADATDALVETKRFVHDALDVVAMVRLVDRPQDSDVILTVLGRGTGHVELTAALQSFDPNVIVSPVMLHAQEPYIEAMLTVGSCGEAATNPTRESKSASCYRKIIVGLDDREVRQAAKKGAPKPWTVCADALAKDVQAWVMQNATRLLGRRG
jgi:hypothetical protein